jgi:hypothetical protein
VNGPSLPTPAICSACFKVRRDSERGECQEVSDGGNAQSDAVFTQQVMVGEPVSCELTPDHVLCAGFLCQGAPIRQDRIGTVGRRRANSYQRRFGPFVLGQHQHIYRFAPRDA